MNRILPPIKYLMAALVMVLASLLTINSATAQRSEYERLAFRNQRPQVNLKVFTLPGDKDGQLKMTAIFQFSNNFFAFKKLDNSQKKAKFYSPVQLNWEVFQSPEKYMKKNKQVDVDGLKSVGRAVWKDTAYTQTYKESKAASEGVSGSLQINVKPGSYTYLLQLNKGDEDTRAKNSKTRNIHFPPYQQQHSNNILLVKTADNPTNPSEITLFNMGNKVIYGKDFYAFIHIPESVKNKTYTVKVARVNAGRKDTTNIEQVFSKKISPDQIMQDIVPRLRSNSKKVSLQLQKQKQGYNYALVKIPNKNYPNAVYRLTVKDNQSKRPVVHGLFRSYWSDIPTSLLSLDVAIKMLHFITSKETVKRINDGSDPQREKKFRAFWKEKDPTPKTEYNELEAEYYHRIDYAYNNFGSQGNPGYDTDRGKVYINFGPPKDVSRKYPPGGATTEIWTYGSRKFVFKATTGFGDYVLVSKKNK